MFGLEVDTTLADAAFLLLRVLLWIALGSLAAGLATLPLFYSVLVVVNGWFWSVDESRNDSAGRSRFRRIAVPGLKWAVPVLSIAATLFLLSYFFGGSGTPGAREASWGKIRFDNATRAIARTFPKEKVESDQKKADPEAIDLSNPEEEALKKPLRIVRMLSMIVLLLVGPFPTLVILLTQAVGRMGLVLIIRSLSRNMLRTGLTYLAIFVLVVVITFVWSILGFLDLVTQEKESNLKAIITERNQIPSQMLPKTEGELLALIEELHKKRGFPLIGEENIMTWSFVGGTLDPKNRTPQNSLFMFCMEPKKILTMMDGLDDLTGEQMAQLRRIVDLMEEEPKTRVVIGKERLAQLGKRVGEEIEVSSFNYKDIKFRLKIVGVFPEGRYDQSAIMHRDYLARELQDYKGRNGREHELATKSLNLIWIRLPDRNLYEVLADEVNKPNSFETAVKMETASSAIGTFLEPMKDLIAAMRYLLVPALIATMTLVIANAISISVRERKTEMAVLKVLGFRPWMVMALVLGEAVLVGALSGFMATATAFSAINAMGGIPFPIAFFPKFFIPADALWWGPAMGAAVAVLGSIIPAWSARSVKVSEVFAKVA